MWKVFWSLLIVAVIAAAAAWLANNPGEFTVVWRGWRIETSFTLVMILGALTLALLIFLYRLMLRTIGGPGALLTYHRTRRRTLGQEALRQGLVAVAAGNPAEVRKLAAKANSLLDDPPLTLLLSAQAAQLEGDSKRAIKAYRKMLENPETEFLGLRGLFVESVKSGDRAEALGLAERAFELEPETPWVLSALFELQSAVGEWAEAARTLEHSVKSKHIAADVAKRKRAVLYTEQALAAEEKGDAEEAEKWASEAMALSPGLVPAAILASRAEVRAGNYWKAAEIIEKAWTVSPHPDLASAYARARKSTIADQDVVSEDELKKEARIEAKWLKGLADFNKDHIESRLLRAAEEIKLGRTRRARKHLEGLAEKYATVRVCQLMAEVEAANPGDPEEAARAAKRWLEKAVSAPRDAHWMCETCGREAKAWHSTCSNCGAFDSLSWKAPADLVAHLTLEPVDLKDEEDEIEAEDVTPAKAAVVAEVLSPPHVDAVIEGVAEDVTPTPASEEKSAGDKGKKPQPLEDPSLKGDPEKNPLSRESLKPKEKASAKGPEKEGKEGAPVPPPPDDPGPDAKDPFTDEEDEVRW